jgi:hypothetical protein
MKALYDQLFREHPGHVGFAPAVLALAACVAVCGSLIYGGVILGKGMLAHTPTVETKHS